MNRKSFKSWDRDYGLYWVDNHTSTHDESSCSHPQTLTDESNTIQPVIDQVGWHREIRKLLSRFEQDLWDGLVQAGYMFGYQGLSHIMQKLESGDIDPYIQYMHEDSIVRFKRFLALDFVLITNDHFEDFKTLIALSTQALNLPLNPDYDPALNLVGSVDLLTRYAFKEGLVRKAKTLSSFSHRYSDFEYCCICATDFSEQAA